MRVSLLFLAVLFTCAGSCGPAAERPQAFDPAQAFAALPSPNELLLIQPRLGSAAAKQASRNVVRMCGDQFNNVPEPQNVTRDELKHTCILDGETATLTYCCFFLEWDYLSSVSDYIDAVSAEINWPGKPPQAPEGIWLGLPNYPAYRWDWYGPLTEAPQWIDPAGGQIRGQMGGECVAVVNYSNGSATLKAINMVCASDTDVPDEYLYYCGLDADNPSINSRLYRVNADGLSLPESCGYADAGDTCSEPCAGRVADKLAICYAFADTAADKTAVWWLDIETGLHSVLRSKHDVNIVPAGWRGDGDVYLIRQLLHTGAWQLMVEDTVLGEEAAMTPEDVSILTAAWYPGESWIDYTAIFSMRIEGPPTRSVIAYCSVDGELPDQELPQVIVDNGTESAIDPQPFSLWDGEAGWCLGFVYSTRPSPEATNELFAWFGGPEDDVDPRLLVHDATHDLRYPAVSPDGTRLAYVAFVPGADSGTLYVTDFICPDADAALLLAEDVTSCGVWFDPH